MSETDSYSSSSSSDSSRSTGEKEIKNPLYLVVMHESADYRGQVIAQFRDEKKADNLAKWFNDQFEKYAEDSVWHPETTVDVIDLDRVDGFVDNTDWNMPYEARDENGDCDYIAQYLG